jgi:glycerophosphoryl diester phosphodiesterase
MRIVRWRGVAALALACLAALATSSAATAGHGGHARQFDLQAHRGGLGLRPESTLSSFANGLETGVSTLELDVQITEDGQAVVTHDRKTDGTKCRDTAPATPNDPEFPYIGKFVNTLTLAQVETLDCGSLTLPQFPQQRPSPGARMPTLRQVFDLVDRHHAHDVKLNVETEPGFLQVGQPGKSVWLDIDDFGGSPVRAAHSFGASALSPVHGNPQNGTVNDPNYVPFTTRAMVDEAHAVGMKVIPWTIDDAATQNKLIDDGVDGIITDYPDRLREVLAARGFALPRAYDRPAPALRAATFNASLNRATQGELVRDLSTGADPQARAVAEVVQRVRPDVLLVNEFDFDPGGVAARLFQRNYLSVPQHGAAPVSYPYRFVAPSNTGIPSGFDLDNNGTVGGGNDALGFGDFPGQFGMAVYSRYPILRSRVRTFQRFLWKDMPGARLPDDPATAAPADWYSPQELQVLRLSSKSHWDLPVSVGGAVVHLLASHPTPPVFDGPEDRNGTRNFDEIRLWAETLGSTPALPRRARAAPSRPRCRAAPT